MKNIMPTREFFKELKLRQKKLIGSTPAFRNKMKYVDCPYCGFDIASHLEYTLMLCLSKITKLGYKNLIGREKKKKDRIVIQDRRIKEGD